VNAGVGKGVLLHHVRDDADARSQFL
jgi:hypothetical protein